MLLIFTANPVVLRESSLNLEVEMKPSKKSSPRRQGKRTNRERKKGITNKICQLRNILQKVISLNKHIAIFTHDNPDPDALGSAFSLSSAIRRMGGECIIFHGGEISHPQTMAIVNLLGINVIRMEEFQADDFGLIIFVDVTSSGQKNLRSTEVKPDVVFDHHDDRPDESVQFFDIREVGATATILLDYLKGLGLELDVEDPESCRIATAIFWAIKTDTKDLTDGSARPPDFEALHILHPFMDGELNKKINEYPRPDYSYEYEAIAEKNGQTQGSMRVIGLGHVAPRRRDVIAYIAEHESPREGTMTVVVFAIIGGSHLHVVIRTKDDKFQKNLFLSSLFGDKNSGGKHGPAGGTAVHLGFLALEEDAKPEEREEQWKLVSMLTVRRSFEFAAGD